MALSELEEALLRSLRAVVRAFHDADELDDLEAEISRAEQAIGDAERRRRR